MIRVLSVLFVIVILAACGPETPAPTEVPATELAMETEAPTEPPVTEEPVATEVPTEAPAPTEAPTEEPPACATLLTPEDGVEIYPVGKLTFSWEPAEGALQYQLLLTPPGGDMITFETDETFRDQYMEAFGMAGEFQWGVRALVANDTEICATEIFTFTKPAYQKPQREGDGGGDAPQGDGGGEPSGPSGGDGKQGKHK